MDKLLKIPVAKPYTKCGFIRFAHEIASLSCMFVETFGIFTYIYAGRL